MTTKFFVQVEPSYFDKNALRARVQISNEKGQYTTRKDGLTLGDDNDQHARFLANLQTCDPNPIIEVREAHFRFCFAWERQPGERKITRRCRHCKHPVDNAFTNYCMNCHERL